jgi:uncharacterized protein
MSADRRNQFDTTLPIAGTTHRFMSAVASINQSYTTRYLPTNPICRGGLLHLNSQLSILVIAVITIFFSPTAGAVNSGCSDTTAPRQHIVCSETILSDLDTKLNDLYESALKSLSVEGGRLLRDDQRNWLRFLSKKCPVPTDEHDWPKIVPCLIRAYSDRVDDLQQAAVFKGPFLFSRVDYYSAIANDVGQVIHHLANPRIDQPVTSQTVRWNQLMSRPNEVSSCDSGNGDIFLSYRTGLTNARIISVLWSRSEYCHATPHGFGTLEADTLLLLPTPHPLRPADLFLMDRPWHERLQTRLLADIQRSVRENSVVPDPFTGNSAERLKQTLAAMTLDPRYWFLQEDGIHFFMTTIFEFRRFVPEVTIPWSDLQGILAPGAPVL